MPTNVYQPAVMPTFTRPTNAPRLARTTAPVGGGTIAAPPALDPRGLVPVNRTQPVATDNNEAQRMMERRLGTMPPSSFAGTGAGFVPVDRPQVGIYTMANQATDTPPAPAIPQQFANLSPDAIRAQVMQHLYGDQPSTPPADPRHQHLADRGVDKYAAMQARMQDVVDRANASGRFSPEQIAAMQEKWGSKVDRFGGPAPTTPTTPVYADPNNAARQKLANMQQHNPDLYNWLSANGYLPTIPAAAGPGGLLGAR